jgi:hypothetical protein
MSNLIASSELFISIFEDEFCLEDGEAVSTSTSVSTLAILQNLGPAGGRTHDS